MQAVDLSSRNPANTGIGLAACELPDEREKQGGLELSDGIGEPDAARLASLTLPGQASQVGVVRRWLTGLVAGLPAAADIVLAASELVANAVCHSDSARQGGTFTIHVAIRAELVRVEVTDAGGPWRVRLGCDDPRSGDASLD